MSTKKNTLLNERVIRRWGKLANMPALTENWLEEQDALEDEEAAAEDEVAAGEAEMEAGEAAEASVGEEEAVERIVNAVVDAIADETGVDIEVEADGDEAAMDDMDAGMDASDDMDDAADDEMDASMRDEDPAMRNKTAAYNRRDITETGAKRDGESKGDKGKDKEDPEDRDYSGKGMRKGDKSKTHAGVDETLELEVIDDEALTEAVLKRVVERLLRRK